LLCIDLEYFLGKHVENAPITVSLTISDPDLTDSEINALTHEFVIKLNRQRELKSELAESPAPGGSKGQAAAVGTIILQLLGAAEQ
jgi:hypothetical protein